MNKTEKAIDLASEAVKQQITLGTAIVAAVVALAGDELQTRALLPLIPIALSTIGGVIALLAMPDTILRDKNPFESKWLRFGGIFQAACFAIGLGAMVIVALIMAK